MVERVENHANVIVSLVGKDKRGHLAGMRPEVSERVVRRGKEGAR